MDFRHTFCHCCCELNFLLKPIEYLLKSFVGASYVCMQKKPPLFNGKFKVLVRVHNTNNNAQVFIRQENAVVDSDAKSRRDVTNTDDNKIMWIA